MRERGASEAVVDSKAAELFDDGRQAYMLREDLEELEVHFDDADRFFVSAKSQNPEEVAVELLEDLAGLKGYFADKLQLDYSPDERVRAFIRGFGLEAASRGDLRTAISVLDVLLEKDDPARVVLQRTLFEGLNIY